MATTDYAIIGGGINGLAVARQIQMDNPKATVSVFEKEAAVACHQTGHNSGVVHAGLYYEKGSLKAKLCRRGAQLIKTYCQTHKLPYDECGKIVVALNDVEETRLKRLYEKSLANDVPGVRMLYGADITAIEPNCIGQAALHSPHTAIVNYRQIAEHIAQEIISYGGSINLNCAVDKLAEQDTKVHLHLVGNRAWDQAFDYVITCAGLQSDRLAQHSGDIKTPKIVPFFGQYAQLNKHDGDKINGLIYPVPDPKYPFLGVHFTKRVDGAMLIGPNAFLSLGRENYSGRRINLKDVLDCLGYGGFWRFAYRNVPAALREAKTVFSRKKFVREAAKYIPTLANIEVTSITRGIRAQAMDAQGGLVDDFVIRKQGRIVHIRNAPSPGATSALAIAEYIVREVIDHSIPLSNNPSA